MADYLRYANSGAKRNLPLDPELVSKLNFLQKMGVTAEVFSGGQVDKAAAARGEGRRTGSVRHDHGNAGDMRFFMGDRRLDWANPQDLPIFEEIVRRGKGAGITGFGAGPGYMEQGTMHVGMGSPVVWGKGGDSNNTPAWLRKAYGMPMQGDAIPAAADNIMAQVQNKQIDPISEVMAQVQNKQIDPISEVMAAAKGSANVGAGTSGATTVTAAAQEPSLGDKIGKALFGEKLAADLKGGFGDDAKPNPLNKGMSLFAGAFGGGSKNNQAQQAAMNIDPTSLGAVEAADAQRSQGAQQLMAALLAGRRRA